jgi:hypothetical protein
MLPWTKKNYFLEILNIETFLRTVSVFLTLHFSYLMQDPSEEMTFSRGPHEPTRKMDFQFILKCDVYT